MNHRLIFSFLFLLIVSFQATAETDSQQWLSVTAQHTASGTYKYGFYLEYQARRSENLNKIYEQVVRPAFILPLNANNSFFLGTMYRLDSENKKIETRPWLQWLGSTKSDYLQLTGRLRYEWRDLESAQKTSERLRLFARLTTVDDISGYGLRPFISSEYFYNLNTVSDNLDAGLQQTRTAVGINYVLDTQLRIDVGYSKVKTYNETRPDQNLDVLTLSAAISF